MAKGRVVVRIDSGLGNQLFQYACGYSVAMKKQYDLVLDPFFIGDIRSYQLERFKLKYNTCFVNKNWEKYLEKRGYNKSLEYRKWKIRKYEFIQENKEFAYDESVYDGERNKYLKGFWQSYKYFDNYYEDLKSQFIYNGQLTKKSLQYIEDMRVCNSVSMHVRRTDYVRAIDNVSIGLNYYQQALSLMKTKIGEFKLFIFSDDKEYVRDKFKFLNYELIEGISDIEEFVCMQNCKHHIIANSTFSWWAAYLSENKGNEVIAPVSGIWKEDFYLPQWDKVKVTFEENLDTIG